MEEITEPLFNALNTLEEKLTSSEYKIEPAAKKIVQEVFERIITNKPTHLELYQEDEKEEKKLIVKRELNNDYIKDIIKPKLKEGQQDALNQIKDLYLRGTAIDACHSYYKLLPKGTKTNDQINHTEMMQNIKKRTNSPDIIDLLKSGALEKTKNYYFKIIKDYCKSLISKKNVELVQASFEEKTLRIDVNITLGGEHLE